MLLKSLKAIHGHGLKKGVIMANINTAVCMIVDYIVANNLYSFNSLTEETQEKLVNIYGESIERQVNSLLTL